MHIWLLNAALMVTAYEFSAKAELSRFLIYVAIDLSAAVPPFRLFCFGSGKNLSIRRLC